MAMNRTVCLVLILAGIIEGSLCLELPSYVTACSRNDPKINDCVLKSATALLPHIVSGDEEYDIPAIDPLDVDELIVDKGIGAVAMNIHLSNVKFHGLKDSVFVRARTELDKKRITIGLKVPSVKVVGPYEIDGKILLLPIQGKGDCNLTFANVDVHLIINCANSKRSDGLEYLKISRTDLALQVKRMYVQLDNLFNGNKFLGDHMNKFMNENWEAIFQELKPAIEKVLGNLVTNILEKIITKIPYDTLFPE